MNKTPWLLGAVIGAGLLALWVLNTPTVSEPTAKPPEATSVPSSPDLPAAAQSAASGARAGSAPQASTILDPERDPKAELAAAELAVQQAEALLDDLSLRLDSLEAQVNDIEARGDDPADHVDEVMPYMRPVLDEYLDAEAKLDAALTLRDTLKAAVERGSAHPGD